MIIRQQQMDVFREYVLRDYETRMLAHVRELFPETVDEFGEEETRAIIRDGVATAAAYGIENEQDTGQFLVLMFLHSFEFDRDGALPGAYQILTRPGLRPDQRLELLWRRTDQYLASGAGVPSHA